MKKLLIVGVALAALIGTPALAADMPVKAPPAPKPSPAYNWTGFYGGLTMGAGWGRSRQTDTAGVTSGSYTQKGGIGGGTIGANYQINNVVLGVEGDFSWSDIKGNIGVPACVANNCFTNDHWIDTERARLGIVMGPMGEFLPYITAGVAGTNFRAGQDNCLGPITICGTKTEWTWTAGGGLEMMIAPKWSAKIEYLYANFGTKVGYVVVIPVNVSEQLNIVRVGVNYHF